MKLFGRPRNLVLLGAGVLGLIALASVIAVIVVTQTSTSLPATAAASRHPAAKAPDFLHTGDDLDNNSREPGVTVATGLSSAPGIVLPSISAAGNPTKVVVDDMVAYGGTGLDVLFSSGIKLFAEPDAQGSVANMTTPNNAAPVPFTDGRKSAYQVELLNGRQYAVCAAGMQTNGNKVFPRVTFYLRGIEYQVTTGSDSVTLSDVIKAAESIE